MDDREYKLIKIAEIKKQQLKLLKKAAMIAALPPGKLPQTKINRCFRIASIYFEIQLLQQRIKLRESHPLPKFEKGA